VSYFVAERDSIGAHLSRSRLILSSFCSFHLKFAATTHTKVSTDTIVQ